MNLTAKDAKDAKNGSGFRQRQRNGTENNGTATTGFTQRRKDAENGKERATATDMNLTAKDAKDAKNGSGFRATATERNGKQRTATTGFTQRRKGAENGKERATAKTTDTAVPAKA